MISIPYLRPLHDAGAALDGAGHATLGAFIAASVRDGQATTASDLVELLASTFPAFDDRSTVGGAEASSPPPARIVHFLRAGGFHTAG